MKPGTASRRKRWGSRRRYAFYEDNPTGTPLQNLIILTAGPLTSLVLGGLFLAALQFGKRRYSSGRLMLFWMAWAGIMTFVNYLIVTPWLAMGDTAAIADILRAPAWARYVVCAIGIAIVLRLAAPARRAMLSIAPQTVPLDSARDRRRFVIRGFYLPLVAGVALSALAGIGGNPLTVGLGLLAMFGSIDIVAAALYFDSVPNRTRAPDAPLRLEPGAIAAYVGIVAVYVVVFSRGMPV